MSIRIFEVGPRDGLQNEPTPIPIEVKKRFIGLLAGAGIKEIEAVSFVSPKWIPQMAEAAELWSVLPSGPSYSALIPNEKGLDRALEVGVRRFGLFTAVSESFTLRNMNMTIAQSLEVFDKIIHRLPEGSWVRAYLSTSFECPFEGRIDPGKTVALVEQILGLGVHEVAISDTVGVASPKEVQAIISRLPGNASNKVAWHFHDTFGVGIANVIRALDAGFTTFDSSAAGLGGCPYAPGAAGNIATEDLVYVLERLGISTGINLDALAHATEEVLATLGRASSSKAKTATLARCNAR